jgi:uncharacterized protein
MIRRTVAWRRVGPDDEGHSVARLEQRPDGWLAVGEEVLLAPEGAIGCRFEIELGMGWLPIRVEADAIGPDGRRRLDLRRDAAGRWSGPDGEIAELAQCLDVDVAATPLTNTFPIRRHADLAIGESRTARVAWIEVPSLRVEPVEQTYTRIAPDEWTYGDPKHGTFRIVVDGDGLVVDYEGFAERIG